MTKFRFKFSILKKLIGTLFPVIFLLFFGCSIKKAENPLILPPNFDQIPIIENPIAIKKDQNNQIPSNKANYKAKITKQKDQSEEIQPKNQQEQEKQNQELRQLLL